MGWTIDEVRDHNERVAKAESEAKAGRSLQNPKPERNQAPALDKATPRKVSRLEKVTVRFTGRRCRLLDADNFAGSVKELLDGLVRAGLLDDDSPEHIILITQQEKVAHRKDEQTIIEIDYP